MTTLSARVAAVLREAVALKLMVADLAENALVRDLLAADPGKLDAEPVMMASAATVMKSIFTTLAMSLLLIFTVVWGWRKWRIG